MSKFSDANFRKQLSTIFIRLAEKIEQDEQFAQWIFEGINFSKGKNSQGKRAVQMEVKSVVSEAIPLPDIFTIISTEGPEGLKEHLNTYEVEILIDIVLNNGLDPVRKVRKRKTKKKIITYIVDVISKQMSKGNTFLDKG
ncbi:hypothetical protein AB4114_22100 [Paenibacillus sp. 2RAB27]|uniref:hypothetical protein n=1 Tax=Paenibacillus sp. 2RAB27 TaxID=3232991 RepID=UPI003F953E42